jgi:hypothetical protein
MHERVGEHSAVVCILVYNSPFFARLSRLGVWIGAP